MKIVKKIDNNSYKEGVIKDKNSEYSILEDFINSQEYELFFNKLLKSVIDNYTNNILNDESKETYEVLYPMKEVNIRVRKALIGIKDAPLVRLKTLEKSLDKLLSSE